MKQREMMLVLAVCIVLIAAIGFTVYETTAGKTTNTAVTEQTTFFSTSCSISGVGGFAFRIVSDFANTTVSGATISVLDGLVGCDETQSIYLDKFTSTQGWLIPVFPSQAVLAGGLRFTVSYQGRIYNFTSYVPPVGSNCVTLRVPSGNVTTQFVMNGTKSC